MKVELLPGTDGTAQSRANVTVSDDQQSLAIGRGGQNVRLAAKLTGAKIDIISAGAKNEAALTPKVADEEKTAE